MCCWFFFSYTLRTEAHGPEDSTSEPVNAKTKPRAEAPLSPESPQKKRRREIEELLNKEGSDLNAALAQSKDPAVIAALEKGDLSELSEFAGGEQKAAKLTAEYWAKNDPGKIADAVSKIQSTDPQKSKGISPNLEKAVMEQAEAFKEKYGKKLALGDTLMAGKSPTFMAARLAAWEKGLQGDDTEQAKVAKDMAKHLMATASPKTLAAQLSDATPLDSKIKQAALRASTFRTGGLISNVGQDSSAFGKALDAELNVQNDQRLKYIKLREKGDWKRIREMYGDSFNMEWAMATGDVAAMYELGKQQNGTWIYEGSWEDVEKSSFTDKYRRLPITAKTPQELASFFKSVPQDTGSISISFREAASSRFDTKLKEANVSELVQNSLGQASLYSFNLPSMQRAPFMEISLAKVTPSVAQTSSAAHSTHPVSPSAQERNQTPIIPSEGAKQSRSSYSPCSDGRCGR